MIRRVRLRENGALAVIDWKRADRLALALRDYVRSADPEERSRLDYDRKMEPLIEGVLCRTIPVPLPRRDAPYDARSQREGWEPMLPDECDELYTRLVSLITGSPAALSLSTHEHGRYVPGEYREVDADGIPWELCWFED